MISTLMTLGTDPMLLADGSGSVQAMLVIAPFIVGPVVFALVYMSIYLRYRNTDKRHAFEREVGVAVGNLRTRDERTDHRRGLRSRTMENANHTQPLERVRRLTAR